MPKDTSLLYTKDSFPQEGVWLFDAANWSQISNGGTLEGSSPLAMAVNRGDPTQLLIGTAGNDLHLLDIGCSSRLVGEPAPVVADLAVVSQQPLRSSVEFALDLDKASDVTARVFDARGRVVASMDLGRLESGRSKFSWDGRDTDGNAASSGVYFVRVRAGHEWMTSKITVLR